jgi:hypothetical protein
VLLQCIAKQAIQIGHDALMRFRRRRHHHGHTGDQFPMLAIGARFDPGTKCLDR